MNESFKRFCIEGFSVPHYIEDFILSILMEQIGKKDKNVNLIASNLSNKEKAIICDGIDSIFKNNIADYNSKEIFYLLYYFPFNMFKIWVPLKDLSYRNALKTNLTVLDIGCGPGTSTIGLIEYYKNLAISNSEKNFSLKIDVVEQNANFISIFKKLVEVCKRNIPNNLSVNINKCFNKDICDIINNLQCDYDLIYASNVFNLNEPHGVTILEDSIISLKNCLKPRGSLIIIEPAEQRVTQNFKKICNNIDQRQILNIFSPCNGVYENCCRCENFAPTNIRVNSLLIDFLQKIGKSVKSHHHFFDYFVFRKDGLKKYSFSEKIKFRKLGDIDWNNVGELVDIESIIISVIPKQDGIAIKMCDGSNMIEGPVYLNLSNAQITKMGLHIQLLKGEKIKLEKVEILKNNELHYGQDSVMEVMN